MRGASSARGSAPQLSLLWWVLGDSRLSSIAASLLGDPATTIFVSAASAHEIATKHRLGKLSAPARLAERLDEMVAENGWRQLPLSIAHAQLAGRLPDPHKDPFDRMLAAQALVENMPLLTNDPAFRSFKVNVLW
jgi:PIN domain nuclease of toxin-antitoxin system